MELLHNLFYGFSLILDPTRILFISIGIIAGTVVGLLPGIGSCSTIAILLPILFGTDPVTGMAMLCAIYYSATYSSAIVAVLLKIPGDASALMTTIDGHELAKKGRSSQAITIAALSSFIGSNVSVVGLMLIAPPLMAFSLNFGPAEHFSLLLLALVLLSILGHDSFIKGMISVIIGLMAGTIGPEPLRGDYRYTLGVLYLSDGLPFISVAMGFFAITDVFNNIEEGIEYKIEDETKRAYGSFKSAFDGILNDFKTCIGSITRGTLVGFFTGVIPGAGATIASFFAYAIEGRFVKTPELYGKGMMQGVAAPEAANSSSVGGAMIPMLTLGIPGSNSTAVMLMGLLLMDVVPGPLLISNRPDVFWSIISSMYVGNLMVLLIVMPVSTLLLARYVSQMKYSLLYPIVLVMVFLGGIGVSGNVFEAWVALGAGVAGYFFEKWGIPLGPMVIALLLGPMFERNLTLALTLSNGSIGIFFERGLSATMMAITFLTIGLNYMKGKKKKKSK